MSASRIETGARVIFLDNLRSLFVLFVIAEHASHAYDNLTWWPVADKNTSIIAEWVSAFSDAFAMPLLFYIAGYFALPSIRRRGSASFLKGKLRRLGVPWLLCILTVCPVLPLIYHFTRNDLALSMSYWDLWVILLKKAAELNVRIIGSMNELMMNNQFYQRYMWFLSLLLLFFFVFSVIYLINKSWFERDYQPVKPEHPSALSTLKLMAAVGLLTAIGSFSMIGIIMALAHNRSNPEACVTFGNIIQFRPSRLFFFIIYFGMGVITYRNKWVERGKFPGHFTTWMISFSAFLIMYLVARDLMLNGPKHFREIGGPIFFLVLNFLTISTLGFFSSIALRYRNLPSTLDQNVASNSYYMYLSHYPFVLVFQLLLFLVPGVPGLLKFVIVSVLGISCSYAVSQFLIKPFPRTSVFVTITLFIVMALVIHP